MSERLPVGAVGGFQGAEILFAFHCGFWREDDAGKIETAEQFEEQQADSASVEILKRMDTQEAAFGKGKQFKGEIAKSRRGGGPAGEQVGPVVVHEDRNLMGCWRREIADADFDVAPAASPGRHKVVTNATVKLSGEPLVRKPCSKL